MGGSVAVPRLRVHPFSSRPHTVRLGSFGRTLDTFGRPGCSTSTTNCRLCSRRFVMNLRVRTVHVFVSPMAFRSPPAPKQELLRPARETHPPNVRLLGQSTRAFPRLFRARVVLLVVPNPTLFRRRHAHVYGSDRHVFLPFPCVRVSIPSSSSYLPVPLRPNRSTSTFRSAIVASTHLATSCGGATRGSIRLPSKPTRPFERKGSGSVPSVRTRIRNRSKGGEREEKEWYRIVTRTTSLSLPPSLSH